jgi:opacity protein-like surface antigen
MISRYLGPVLAAAFVAMIAPAANAGPEPVPTPVEEVPAPAPVPAPVVEVVSTTYAWNAPYVSAGGVYGIQQNKSNVGHGRDFIGSPKDYSDDLTDSGGYDLRIGYGFKERFAAEVEWQSLVNFSSDAQFDTRDSSGADHFIDAPSLEARMLSFNGRVAFLTGRFQPYALLGLGWYNVQADRVSVSTHESSFASRFGLGIAAFITERTGVAFEAGYILPMTGVIAGGKRFDLIPMTLSVFFKFK